MVMSKAFRRYFKDDIHTLPILKYLRNIVIPEVGLNLEKNYNYSIQLHQVIEVSKPPAL